jgi:hypothetical protein
MPLSDLPDFINAAYAEFQEQWFEDDEFKRRARHLKDLLLAAHGQIVDHENHEDWEEWLDEFCDVDARKAADIIKIWAA